MIPLFKVHMAEDAGTRVNTVLQSGYIGEGPRVEEFERVLQAQLNSPVQPLALNSCTSALTLALVLLGVGPGDEVITTPITCTATNSPIVTLGARPVWADVDPITGNIDPEDVRNKITPRTKAIIAVDWSGRFCDYNALRILGFPVIQDAAHGPLIDWNNRGDYICLSFQAIKHLTTGDGGALLVPGSGTPYGIDMSSPTRRRARLLRWYGLDRTSGTDFRCAQDIKEVGYKFHMNDIAATIGLANVQGLQERVSRHRQNAWDLANGIENSRVTIPEWDPKSNYWVFTILLYGSHERDRMKEWLQHNGIASSQVHARNDKHTGFQFPNGPLRGVDQFDSNQLSIPCGWWLSDKDVAYIINVIRSF